MRKSFCLQSLHFRHTWSKEGRWDEPAKLTGLPRVMLCFRIKLLLCLYENAGCPVCRDLLVARKKISDLWGWFTSYKHFLSRNENQVIRVYFIIQTKAKEMYPKPFLFNNLLMNALWLVIHQFREVQGATVTQGGRALTSHKCGRSSNPGVHWLRRVYCSFYNILASLAIWFLVDRSSYSNSVMSLWLQLTGLRYH